MKDVEEVLFAAGIPEMAIQSAKNRIGDDAGEDALWKHFVNEGKITESKVFQAFAQVSYLEYIDLRTREIPTEVLTTVAASFCREENLIPVDMRGETLFIGTPDPENFTAIDEIAAQGQYEVMTVVVSPTDLREALNRYLRADEEIGKLSQQIEQMADEDVELDDLESDDDESPNVKFVNLIIAQAIQDRASDIHVEPGENNLVVRYRIDGVLHEVNRASKSIQRGVISRLKIMSDIDIGERRKPQDGRITIKHSGQSIDIRVVTLPTTWGEKVVMRILDHGSEKRSIESIGMSTTNEMIFREALSKPHGMILVTGPTGSGKSTSMYTAIGEVVTPEVNVVTVEDPVEKKIPGVSQIQINERAGMTFSGALRSILRADPDIVFVGEIRDQETAKIAVDASMTGHLVLSTLHTNGAPEAASRLIEMGVEPYLVGSSVSCVVAQRLARKLCTDCKQPVEADAKVMNSVGYTHTDTQFFKPVGCPLCSNTGYRGRIALTEVLEMTEELEPFVIQRMPASGIRREAEKRGFRSLRLDGWDKVNLGLTTIEEVLRVAA
jgi:type II secretory ATPase GspE/PulE/Tfp pilus assembly ATPase PilB-like protein